MFDSLDEQMKHDDQAEGIRTREKMLRWVVVVVVALLLFGGLYFGVKLLE